VEGLKEHQLAVLFRNNHFNALFKHEGSLFILVTDQGYLHEPDVVWERLDAVDGNTQLCAGDFSAFRPHVEEIPPELLADGGAAAAAAAVEAAGAPQGMSERRRRRRPAGLLGVHGGARPPAAAGTLLLVPRHPTTAAHSPPAGLSAPLSPPCR
jgi:hypothetical protein